MKKHFLSFVLVLALCFPFLTACGGGTTSIDVKNSLTELFQNQNITNIINGELDYPERIQTKIQTADERYAVLEVYSQILNAEFKIINNNFGSFAISAPNAKNENSLCKKVLDALNEFNAETENFISSKDYYFGVIENIELDNVIADNNLNVFKQAFSNLIVKANALNLAFVNAHTNLYGNPDFKNENNTYLKSVTLNAYADFLNVYVQFAFVEFNCLHKNITAFYDSLTSLINKINSSSFNQSNFSAWLEVYTAYEAERDIVLEGLEKIDLNSEITGEKNIIYKNKIERFVLCRFILFQRQKPGTRTDDPEKNRRNDGSSGRLRP